MTPEESLRLPRIRYNLGEWAGAFGDLGTLIPFVAGYIVIAGMDAFGVLFSFGLALILAGLFYRVPFPVQPMKAIGAIATTQGASLAITPAAIGAAGLVTGLLWLVLGLTGLGQKMARLVSRPVIGGLILGLGASLMLQGFRLLATQWVLGLAALALTGLLIRRSPAVAMLALLAFGIGAALWLDPTLGEALAAMEPALRLPAFALGALDGQAFVVGALLLALPQAPLTLGNAVVAITHEHNRLFPARPIGERTVSVSTGLMNLGAATLGGVPMCHGAGGLAGHVRFGARTGGAVIILGALLLGLALFYSGSVTTVFRLFPTPVLGVILLYAGFELVRGVRIAGMRRAEHGVLAATAVTALWHVGLAFVVGLALQYLLRPAKT
ncbi:sulfate transporter [Sulfurifustis variabilis]|uniref:Sulfate transporter n=1 Tax=Sulfurifustis variabilis TaxID=1675686 RepID=A0A1B4VC85_9GAMM|nr:putative sulfate/molybdate transporter [Sulfurifustis variabilis]BAU48901.1 sulfate transporter [Sulfurifustis variabilis]